MILRPRSRRSPTAMALRTTYLMSRISIRSLPNIRRQDGHMRRSITWANASSRRSPNTMSRSRSRKITWCFLQERKLLRRRTAERPHISSTHRMSAISYSVHVLLSRRSKATMTARISMSSMTRRIRHPIRWMSALKPV